MRLKNIYISTLKSESIVKRNIYSANYYANNKEECNLHSKIKYYITKIR